MRGFPRRAPRALVPLLAAGLMAALAGCDGDPAGSNGQTDPCEMDPNLPQCPGPPGTFAYLPEASLAYPLADGVVPWIDGGDFNGDGRLDIVIIQLRGSPALNRVHVAFGQANGTFVMAPAPAESDRPPPVEGWVTYLWQFVGDVNGDGDDDLIWNHLGTNNVVYVALSNGNGTFGYGPRQVHTQTSWVPYTASVGDMNGDGKADVVWNARSTASTRTYVGFATGADGTLTMINNGIDQPGDYSEYDAARLGRFNGDPFDDVLLSAISDLRNDTYIGRFTPVGAAGGSLTWTVHREGADWRGYYLMIGDIDGSNGDDLGWSTFTSDETAIYTVLNDGTGTFQDRSERQSIPLGGPTTGERYFLPSVADFDGDGRGDAIVNRTGPARNEFIVVLGTADGVFEVRTGVQTHPHPALPGWNAFVNRLVGDVNGDGRADLVWCALSTPGHLRIFVALARGN